jgi:DNA-binding NarL/FixJ family response regulator
MSNPDFCTSVKTRSPTGDEGLKLASRNVVDIVIVDYFMPEMDGREVAAEMRRVQPKATIIMLSGGVDIPEGVFNLVDAFVTKDRLASQLLPAIANCRWHQGSDTFSRTATLPQKPSDSASLFRGAGIVLLRSMAVALEYA